MFSFNKDSYGGGGLGRLLGTVYDEKFDKTLSERIINLGGTVCDKIYSESREHVGTTLRKIIIPLAV